MSRAEDVNTLFRRFGGNAETYQEIVAMQQVESAVSKWPMLDQIRVQIHPSAPSAPLADLVRAERARQVIPEPVHVYPQAVDEATVLAVEPPAQVSVQPAVALAALKADVPEVPPVIVPEQPVVSTRMESPPVSPMRAPEVAASVADAGTGLQSMFRRMVPKRQASQAAAPVNPLKRLAKW